MWAARRPKEDSEDLVLETGETKQLLAKYSTEIKCVDFNIRHVIPLTVQTLKGMCRKTKRFLQKRVPIKILMLEFCVCLFEMTLQRVGGTEQGGSTLAF